MNASEFFRDKKIIVTGGVGSVGWAIARRLLQYDVKLIRVIDNNESVLFDLENSEQVDRRLEFYHCDICDQQEMMRTFSDMDYCFHAAALKHVPSCERSPHSAVNVNIVGSQRVIDAAIENGLQKVLFTSSDKAVNPTNVMGTSKLMGERLFTAMNFLRARESRTSFSSTRFGNVAGSRGSVIPLFVEQIRRGGPVTLTDERMTRFVMSLAEAAELVTESMMLAKGGEVFITKMPVVRIEALARLMINIIAPLFDRDPSRIEIKIIGSRPGEKLWEELTSGEESRRLLEGEKFLIVLPAVAPPDVLETYRYDSLPIVKSIAVYHSDREPKMTEAEMVDFLMLPEVLPEEIRRRLAESPSAKAKASA